MGEDHAQAKRALRPALRAARRGLSDDDRARRSAAACARLARTPLFRNARHVVLYAPDDGEVDVTAVATAARDAGVPTYYPRLRDSGLEFVGADPADLRRGRLGVKEPDGDSSLAPSEEGVVFVVPAVAFDLSRARLGRGGGHYDRALASYRAASSIGIGFEFQILPRLPIAPWDVAMSAVVTDARVLGDGAFSA
jgi:5-formyltetrahydrofolate cyclo-ligase